MLPMYSLECIYQKVKNCDLKKRVYIFRACIPAIHSVKRMTSWKNGISVL